MVSKVLPDILIGLQTGCLVAPHNYDSDRDENTSVSERSIFFIFKRCIQSFQLLSAGTLVSRVLILSGGTPLSLITYLFTATVPWLLHSVVNDSENSSLRETLLDDSIESVAKTVSAVASVALISLNSIAFGVSVLSVLLVKTSLKNHSFSQQIEKKVTSIVNSIFTLSLAISAKSMFFKIFFGYSTYLNLKTALCPRDAVRREPIVPAEPQAI